MATIGVRSGLDYNSAKLFHGTLSSSQPAHSINTDDDIPGFPRHYTGERVWSGSDMLLEQDKWTVILSEQDQAHVMEGLRHFQGLGLAPESINPNTFPLPQELSARLKLISHDCYNGRGFGVLRGLDPAAFTDEENVVVFAGVSSHVAPKRGFQDVAREQVTCHVISEDTRPGAKEQNLRPAFTNGRLAFHTDLGDLLTLYSMEVSDVGGETMIASSSRIYNEIAATRPDLLQELREDWAFFGSQDYHTNGTPLVTNAAGDKLVFQYSRLPVTGFRNQGANPSLPPPSARRLEAMTVVEELAWKHAFPLPRQAGDIAFINNLCLMHARSAFDLDPEGIPLPSKRHLVKLMLQDPELTWELPQSLSWYTHRVYGPNRSDGTRAEKWQLSVASDESLPHVWAGSGSASNG